MKKIIVLLLVVFAVKTGYSQTAPKTPQPFVLTAKDSLLAKAWRLMSYERFAVQTEPGEKEKNDGVTFLLDQTAFVTMDGNAITGKWITDRAKTLITVTADGTNEVWKFKIVKLGPAELVLKFQDKELMTTVYTYVPK